MKKLLLILSFFVLTSQPVHAFTMQDIKELPFKRIAAGAAALFLAVRSAQAIKDFANGSVDKMFEKSLEEADKNHAERTQEEKEKQRQFNKKVMKVAGVVVVSLLAAAAFGLGKYALTTPAQ